MKKTRFQQVQDKVASYYEGEQRQRILANMTREYDRLCRTYDGDRKSVV